MKKTFAVTLILIFAISNIIVIENVNASAKPSVPEFTVKYLPSSYTQTTTDAYTGEKTTRQIDNGTMEISIKNQAFPTTINGVKYILYYDVGIKGHFSDQWEQLYYYYNYSKDSQSSGVRLPSTDTVFTTTSVSAKNYQADSQVDFQVKALVMYEGEIRAYDGLWDFYGHMVPGYVLGEDSGWSGTQTVTITGSEATSPTSSSYTSAPTVTPNETTSTTATPNQSSGFANLSWEVIALLTGLVAVVAVLSVGMVLLWRKVNSKTTN